MQGKEEIIEKWRKESFINQMNEIDKRKIITVILAEYYTLRNIQPTDPVYIIGEVVKGIRNLHFLKPVLIRWALKEFNNNTVNNLSVLYILELIEKGYKSEFSKQLLEEKNSIAENSLTLLNKEALETDWNKCLEAVKSNMINLEEPHWRGGYKYLKEFIKYECSDNILQQFQEQAIQEVIPKMKKNIEKLRLMGNKTLAKEIENELKKPFKKIPAVVLLRNKLITMNYIINQ